jgi:hypothetical protein
VQWLWWCGGGWGCCCCCPDDYYYKHHLPTLLTYLPTYLQHACKHQSNKAMPQARTEPGGLPITGCLLTYNMHANINQTRQCHKQPQLGPSPVVSPSLVAVPQVCVPVSETRATLLVGPQNFIIYRTYRQGARGNAIKPSSTQQQQQQQQKQQQKQQLATPNAHCIMRHLHKKP